MAIGRIVKGDLESKLPKTTIKDEARSRRSLNQLHQWIPGSFDRLINGSVFEVSWDNSEPAFRAFFLRRSRDGKRFSYRVLLKGTILFTREQ